MPPLSLLAALAAAAQLQICFGQQISDGVTAHKLAQHQHFQNQNFTDAALMADSEQNYKIGKIWDHNDLNQSTTFPSSGARITNLKFVRNPAYEGPAPSFAVMNSKNAPVPISGTSSRNSVRLNLQRVSPNGEAPNVTGQIASKQSEDNTESISKSPVFISFAPQFAGASLSQTPYCSTGLPVQSPSPNMYVPSISPPLNQQSHPTSSSVQYQPSNIQNPSNMRVRFVPALSTIPSYNTAPMQNAIPIQNAMQMQKIVDNTIHDPYLPFLLSHLFSQSTVKQEHLAPSIMRYANQEQKPSKVTVVKKLLPLLLELLTENNNNCCEYKLERSRSDSKHKQGSKQVGKFRGNSFEHTIRSHSGDHRNCVNHDKASGTPCDDSMEYEDYSNESSDYSAEDYDDEN